MKKAITVLKWIGIFLVAWTAFGYVLMATGVVKEDKPVVLNEHPRVVTVCQKAGLGDTFDEIDRAWGVYKKKAESGNRFKVGPSENQTFAYDTQFGHPFGNPPRAGSIDGVTKNWWCKEGEEFPNKQAFFNGIKDFMPREFSLIKTYYREEKDLNCGTYIFLCNSSTLANVPDIEKAWNYNKKYYHNPKIGNFVLYVHERINDTNHIDPWYMVIASEVSKVDIEHAKEINYNPWVVDSDK